MVIVKERTRLVFSEYTSQERAKLEEMVATIDKVFSYIDEDNQKIYIPPGMLGSVKKSFPQVQIIDNSAQHWPFEYIKQVDHSMEPRNQLQIDAIKFGLNNAQKKNKVGLILSPGVGKAQPISTRIPTPDGWKLMGDLQVGDKVFGSDGKPVSVTGVFDQGIRDIYEIKFSDGRTAECCKEHLWNIIHPWSPEQRTMSLEEIMKDYKRHGPLKDHGSRDPHIYNYRIPLLSSPVQYESKPVSIDPYIIGAFLGDGCLSEKYLVISSGDHIIPSKIAKITGFEIYPDPANNHYYFRNPDEEMTKVRTDDFFGNFPNLIKSSSSTKKIPYEYMYNSLDVRMKLLQGLMDTDGSISYSNGRFNVSFTSCSKELLFQVKELIQGLGFIANIIDDKRTEKYREGYCGTVDIRVPNKFKYRLFSMPRKVIIANEASVQQDHQQPFRHLLIKDIKMIKREEARCITVDARDHLYLTDNFIVTHNTFIACYMAIKLGLRTLIVVPTTNIKNQWGETLTDMFNISRDRVLVVSSPKDFINVKQDFVVVSQASLAALNKTYDLEKIMKINKFGVKVIDEVQMWFHNIIRVDGSSNICHNWYLTGTFGRSSDEENQLYQEMFGEIALFREKDKKPTFWNLKPGNVYGMKPHMNVNMMWTKSGLTSEQILSVSSSKRYSERAEKWMRYGISIPAYTKLVIPDDGSMTQFLDNCLQIIRDAQNHIDYGKTLILSATIVSVEILAQYVQKMFPNLKVGTIHSRKPKIESNRVKEECDIMISTVQSSGTGFDVKGLSRLVVIQAFKSWILTDQVSGRLRRRDDGKDTYMWDVVDSTVPQLVAWANARADVLKRKSKRFKVIDF